MTKKEIAVINLVWPRELKIKEARQLKVLKKFEGTLSLDEKEALSGEIKTPLGKWKIDGAIFDGEIMKILAQQNKRTIKIILAKERSEESICDLWTGEFFLLGKKINLTVLILL